MQIWYCDKFWCKSSHYWRFRTFPVDSFSVHAPFYDFWLGPDLAEMGGQDGISSPIAAVPDLVEKALSRQLGETLQPVRDIVPVGIQLARPWCTGLVPGRFQAVPQILGYGTPVVIRYFLVLWDINQDCGEETLYDQMVEFQKALRFWIESGNQQPSGNW